MNLISNASVEWKAVRTNKRLIVPFVLVTGLFFLWGIAYGLLDILSKYFQGSFIIIKSRSMLLQAVYFGAYFLMALPAGAFISRHGYKKGIVTGLLVYACGSFLFYPAMLQENFNLFLFALFILACGLSFVETAVNPYITILGKPQTAALRLNLSQCFNGVGSFIVPVIAANLFFGKTNTINLNSVRLVYAVTGIIVLLMAALFIKLQLPEANRNRKIIEPDSDRSLFSFGNFRGAVIAQFFYVSAHVGVAAFFISYCTQSGNQITNVQASYFLSIGLLLFTLGRFTGTALLCRIKVNKLLTAYALINVVLCAAVISLRGWIPVYALMATFFFESIMFPSIFALGIKGLGAKTKRASSFIIMSTIGGAFVPCLMELIANNKTTAVAYIVPLICFLVVGWFGSRRSHVSFFDRINNIPNMN